MKYLSTTVAIAVLGLALSAQAHAATLYTSPVDAIDSSVYCDVVNARKTPIAITIEVYDLYGGLKTSVTNAAVQPGQAMSNGHPLGVYCKFKVGGPKRSVAAMAIYTSNTTGYYTTAELAR